MGEFALLAINAIFISNIMTYYGYGLIGLQTEKKNFLYLIISCATTIMGVIVGGVSVFAVVNYVLIPLDVVFLKMFIIVFIALVMSYLSRLLIKFTSKESFYLFEKSYQFAAQTVLMVGIMLVFDYTLSLLNSMFLITMYCAGYILVQLLMYAIYDKLDNGHNLKPARNVPLMLYTISIIGIILSAIGMLF